MDASVRPIRSRAALIPPERDMQTGYLLAFTFTYSIVEKNTQ